jgi:hypothetical protein
LFELPNQNTYTTHHMNRMVGWLKNFVQTRARPAASLVKGYTIHMLARRAPFALAQEFEIRRRDYGKDMAKRGHLTLASTMIASRADKPGCGKVFVTVAKRNRTKYQYARLPAAFKLYYKTYQSALPPGLRLSIDTRRIKFRDILKGTQQ